jgi:hypothetical protein
VLPIQYGRDGLADRGPLRATLHCMSTQNFTRREFGHLAIRRTRRTTFGQVLACLVL